MNEFFNKGKYLLELMWPVEISCFCVTLVFPFAFKVNHLSACQRVTGLADRLRDVLLKIPA